jgi:hypothetical protein
MRRIPAGLEARLYGGQGCPPATVRVPSCAPSQELAVSDVEPARNMQHA